MNSESNLLHFPLSIFNWNVRGLGDANKCAIVKDVICDAKPDLICLQETKWNESSIFTVRQICPSSFKNYIALDATGSRDGILLTWTNNFTSSLTYQNTFSISAILHKQNFKFLVTVVYGPQRDSEKIIFLNELKGISESNELPWVILGDFNMHREHNDTTANTRNLGIMLEFNRLISDEGLEEVPLQGRSFTWSNKRPIPTFSKLDRALISEHWRQHGTSNALTDLPATASDHTPLMLTIKPHIHPRTRRFRFELYWLRHRDIGSVVQEAWNSVQSGSRGLTTSGTKQ